MKVAGMAALRFDKRVPMRSCVLFFLAVAMAFGQTCRPDQIRTSTHCCDGSAGSLYASVLIRNASRQACLIEGVPKVKPLADSGKALPVTIRGNEGLNNYGKGSDRLMLQPGAKAGITVVTQEPNFDQNRCSSQLVLDINGVIVALKMLACGPPQQPLRVFTSGFYPAPEEFPASEQK
jgi:hypothetical protein